MVHSIVFWHMLKQIHLRGTLCCTSVLCFAFCSTLRRQSWFPVLLIDLFPSVSASFRRITRDNSELLQYFDDSAKGTPAWVQSFDFAVLVTETENCCSLCEHEGSPFSLKGKQKSLRQKKKKVCQQKITAWT